MTTASYIAKKSKILYSYFDSLIQHAGTSTFPEKLKPAKS